MTSIGEERLLLPEAISRTASGVAKCDCDAALADLPPVVAMPRPSRIGVPFSVARISPGRLKVLDDGISMNLIQPSAWHAILAYAARGRAEIARASLKAVRRP